MRKRTTVLCIIAAVLFILAVSACSTISSTTPLLSSTTSTDAQPVTLPPGQEPVEIVSVTGPLQPINPGGPIVEITLKNAGAEPIIFLSADLFILRAGPPNMPAFVFTFKVASGNPLLPGNSTSVKQTLIGGGYSDTITYPLTINGTLQNGTVFSYTKQVFIVPPSN
jgi:hypothetical protein